MTAQRDLPNLYGIESPEILLFFVRKETMSVLEKNVKLTNVIVILGILIALGGFFRLYDLGRMAYHHDESMHAYYSFRLFKYGPHSSQIAGDPSRYTPVYHGPFQYHIGALFFFLFGDSDYTGRLPHAVFGIVLLCLAYGLSQFFGRRTALITVFLLAVSPVLVYFSRFTREDTYFAVSNFALVLFSLLYLKTRRPLYFHLSALGLILGYCTKENSYMSGAILGSFLVLYVLWGLLSENRNRHLGLVFSTYHQYTKAWTLYGLFSVFMFGYAYAVVHQIKLFGKVLATRASTAHDNFETSITGLGVLYWIIALIVSAAVIWLVAWARRSFRRYDPYLSDKEKRWEEPDDAVEWLKRLLTDNQELLLSICLVVCVYVVLFTRMFSNSGGIWSGVYDYLAYWMAQQEEPRIPGPKSYHIVRLLVYELLAVVFSVIGLFYVVYRSTLHLFAKGTADSQAEVPQPPSAIGVFLLYWSLMSVFIYSHLNEKCPWLLTHQALPMVLFAGWVFGELWERLRGHWGWSVLRGALLVVFVILAAAMVRSTVVLNLFQNDDPKEMIVYVQSQQDVIGIRDEIEDLAFRTVKRKNLKVLLTGKAPWPFSWYMRNYPYTSFGTVTEGTDADVVICDDIQKKDAKAALGNDFDEGRTYHLQGWWVVEHEDLPKGFKQRKDALLKYFIYREPWGKKTFGHWDIALFVRSDIYGVGGRTGVSIPAGYKNSPAYPSVLKEWGKAGAAPGQFNKPKGIAIAPNDAGLYVADSGNHRIQKFDLDGNSLLLWGDQGTAPAQFNEPSGIAVGPDGMVYVADLWNARIQKFDSEGKFITQWDAGDGRFYGPRDVGVSPKNEVFVADTGNKRIMVYSSDGQFLRKWGSGGKQQGQFDEPVGLAISSGNEVFVADTVNQRVQVFDDMGTFKRQWAVLGWDDRYTQPYLALDSRGTVFASDAVQNVIHRFLPDGSAVTRFGSKGTAPGQMDRAVGIAVDSQDNVYIADTDNNRIQKWAPLRHIN